MHRKKSERYKSKHLTSPICCFSAGNETSPSCANELHSMPRGSLCRLNRGTPLRKAGFERQVECAAPSTCDTPRSAFLLATGMERVPLVTSVVRDPGSPCFRLGAAPRADSFRLVSLATFYALRAVVYFVPFARRFDTCSTQTYTTYWEQMKWKVRGLTWVLLCIQGDQNKIAKCKASRRLRFGKIVDSSVQDLPLFSARATVSRLAAFQENHCSNRADPGYDRAHRLHSYQIQVR